MTSSTLPALPAAGALAATDLFYVVQDPAGTPTDTKATGTQVNTLVGAALVSDTAYASSWDGVTGVAPSKNAVYDKFEALMVPAAPISGNVAALQFDPFYTTQSSTGIANTIYGATFRIYRRVSISKLGLFLGTGSAGGKMQCAIYNNVNGLPGTSPVVATGDLSTTTTGVVLETLGAPVVLDPGLYWRFFNRDNTTAQIVAGTIPLSNMLSAIIGNATASNVYSPGQPDLNNHINATRTFGTWGDISGLSYAWTRNPRDPVLAVGYT